MLSLFCLANLKEEYLSFSCSFCPIISKYQNFLLLLNLMLSFHSCTELWYLTNSLNCQLWLDFPSHFCPHWKCDYSRSMKKVQAMRGSIVIMKSSVVATSFSASRKQFVESVHPSYSSAKKFNVSDLFFII